MPTLRVRDLVVQSNSCPRRRWDALRRVVEHRGRLRGHIQRGGSARSAIRQSQFDARRQHPLDRKCRLPVSSSPCLEQHRQPVASAMGVLTHPAGDIQHMKLCAVFAIV